MFNRLTACLIVAPLLAAGPVLAADVALEAEPPVAVVAAQEGWIVTLKATGTFQPKFEGTSKYGISGFPGLSLRRPGQPWKFGAPDDGFGFALIDTPWFQAGPVGRIRSERDSSDVKRFFGMKDVDYAIEPGAFIEFYPLEMFRVRGELRHGFWGHDGVVGNVSADYIQRFDRTVVSFGPRMELGNGEFMNTYFGVDREEAANSPRIAAPYKAKGGIKSVGLAGAVTYDVTENWAVTGFGAYNRLVGEAADSPVARRIGTKNAFTAGLGVAYSFGVDW
jgi:outer membrane protein